MRINRLLIRDEECRGWMPRTSPSPPASRPPKGPNYGEIEEPEKPAPKPVFGRPMRRIRRRH